MSDTPETDAKCPWRYSITTPDGKTTLFVPADFARKLERERDEARRLLGIVRQALGSSLEREKFILEQEKFILGLVNEEETQD